MTTAIRPLPTDLFMSTEWPGHSRRPKLYILMGIPGTGKSTWAKRFLDHLPIVSSDAIREHKWPGESYDETRNEEVFAEFHERIDGNLDVLVGVVADATNCNYLARERLIRIGRDHDAEIHLVVFGNLLQAKYRNKKRNGDKQGNLTVPDDAMKHMVNKFVESREAIGKEGYDSITWISGVT